MADANDWNSKIIEEFRRPGGKVGGPFEGAPLLLLPTVGAKTGQDRVNPMVYRQVGDSVAVFASKAGAPTNPDWYHNLVANPRVSARSAPDAAFVARVAQGAERDRIWEAQKRANPTSPTTRRKTTRRIPVVVLEPAQQGVTTSTGIGRLVRA